jgi:5'-deoxynucleotidase YfbR-like HD superfamily hydrolase
MINKKRLQQAHDDLLKLGDLTVKFASVHRSTLYPDGHYENDTEHSFHLAISATEIAATYHSELDMGLVSQFSIVHDLAEIYAGDVPSFDLNDDERVEKEKAEKIALEKLLNELPSHTAQLLRRYENQEEPEARFVRLIDKLLPPVIHIVATEANREDFFSRYNITTVEDIDKGNELFLARLQQMFPEFDSLLIVRELVAQTSRNCMFPSLD